MGRMVSVSFSDVAVSVAQDLFEALAATGKPFILHEVVVSQRTDYGDAAAEGLSIFLKRATGSYTSGSGGSTSTGGKQSTNDPTPGSTVELNNTTQASAGSGVLTTLRAECFNVQAGYQYLPAPEDRFVFLPAEALVVSVTVPADSLTCSGTLVYEEL